MPHIRKLRLSLLQNKAGADRSKFLIGSNDMRIKAVTSVRVLGYNITGSANPLPNHVLLVFKNLQGGGEEHVQVTNGDGQRITEQNEAHIPLYLPGGIASQARIQTTIGDGATLMNLQNVTVELQEYDSASQQYIRWDDYTDAFIELQVFSYENISAVKRTTDK